MTPYVVRKFRAGPIIQMVVVIAFLFLGPRLLGLNGFPWIFVAAFVATGLWYAWQATLVLRRRRQRRARCCAAPRSATGATWP